MSATSRIAGDRSESEAIDELPWLRYVTDETAEHYDAVARETRWPLQEGDPVEIKSAGVVLADGAPGRFYIRRRQHERLLEDDGWYLFVVCEPNPERRRLLSYRFLEATAVDDDFLTKWWDAGDDRSEYRQIRWTDLIDKSEVKQ